MSANGWLVRPGILDRASAAMINDIYITVQVRRSVSGVESYVTTFQTRLAGTTSAATGRDAQAVQGNAAERLFVALAPKWADVQKDDELWNAGTRYRVIAVDKYPHKQQLLLQEIQ